MKEGKGRGKEACSGDAGREEEAAVGRGGSNGRGADGMGREGQQCDGMLALLLRCCRCAGIETGAAAEGPWQQ